MLTLLVPASTPTGVDIYTDEAGTLTEVPAGSPPPGGAPVDPARLAAEQRILQQEAAAGATNTPGAQGTAPGVAAQGASPLAATPAAPPAAVPAPVPTMSASDAEAFGQGAVAGQPMPAATKPKLVTIPQAPLPPISGSMRANMDVESSSGKNKNHEKIVDPKSMWFGKTASGSWGLMPDNVVRTIEKYPDLRAKYYDTLVAPLKSKSKGDKLLSVEDADFVKAHVDASDTLDFEVAVKFWEEHLRSVGHDENRARAKWFGGYDGLKAWDKHVANPTAPKSKYAQGIVEDVEKYEAARSVYKDETYDHPLFASSSPATGLPAGMASDAQFGGSAQPELSEPLPFDDFEPAWPGEQPPEDPLGPYDPAQKPQMHGPPIAPQPQPWAGPQPGAPGDTGAVGKVLPAIAGAAKGPLTKIAENQPPPSIMDVLNPVGSAAAKIGAAAPFVAPGLKAVGRAAVGAVKDVATLEPLGTSAAAAAQADAGAAPKGPVDPSRVATNAPGAPTTAPSAGAAPAAAPLSEVDALRKQIREARDAYSKGPGTKEIDPQRLWKSKSTGGKILSALALAMGTFGASMTGGQNAALAIIQQAIADDIESQKLTAAQQQAAWAASYNVIDSMIDELAVIAPEGGAGKAPPASMLMAAAGKVAVIRNANRLEDLHAKLPMGSGPASTVGKVLPIGSKGSDYEAERHTFVNDLIFAISGKAATDIERKAWTRLVPSAYATKARAKGAFEAIRRWAETAYTALDEQAMMHYGRSLDSLSPDERAALLPNGRVMPDDELVEMLSDLEDGEEGE